MDRKIPIKEIRKAMIRKWVSMALTGTAVVVTAIIVIQLAGNKADISKMTLSTADTGDIQTSITASGSVAPEYQEIIVSPVNTRIVEVFCKSGDNVDEGTPLLRLDLQTAETDYRKGLDDYQMRQLELKQLKVNQNTKLTDLDMKIKVARMALDSKRMQMRNEEYLDSIGSGTTDRVRQARLDYNTSKLELEQLNKQYENEKKAAEAECKVQELNIQMFEKGLADMHRILEDAKIRSPRKAVLTYINTNKGQQVAQGEHVATVADLSTFKVECSIADGYTDRMTIGGKVMVRTGNECFTGMISNISPQNKNGMIDFTVCLDKPDNAKLRPGLKVEAYVLTSERTGVVRIANGAFYKGPGKYRLFVKEGDRLVARDIQLGEAGYDHIEVVNGLRPGEQAVVGDMEKYKGRKEIKIK